MLCLYPVTLQFKDESGLHYQDVPCGKCEHCLVNKQSYSTTRAIMEMQTSGLMMLVTLTYAPENYPRTKNGEYATLDKSHPDKYLKRLRKAGYVFRQMGSGEYGDVSWHPHYHILFFLKNEEIPEQVLKEKWPHGFVDVKIVGLKNAFQGRKKDDERAVTDYVMKHQQKIYPASDGWDKKGDKYPVPPYTFRSRPHLGAELLKHMINALNNEKSLDQYDGKQVTQIMNQGIRWQGKTYSLDPYIKSKIIEATGGDLEGAEKRRLRDHLEQRMKPHAQYMAEKMEAFDKLEEQKKRFAKRKRQYEKRQKLKYRI